MTDVFMEYREEFEAYRDDAMKDIKQMSNKKDPGAFVDAFERHPSLIFARSTKATV